MLEDTPQPLQSGEIYGAGASQEPLTASIFTETFEDTKDPARLWDSVQDRVEVAQVRHRNEGEDEGALYGTQ